MTDKEWLENPMWDIQDGKLFLWGVVSYSGLAESLAAPNISLDEGTMSILTGIGNLVDDWLKIKPKGKPPHYRHRSAANELSQRHAPITGTREYLQTSYAQIHRNRLTAIDAGHSNPSKENWRWERHLDLAANNKSPELQLERAIVNACGDNWSNQMPTASGLIDAVQDKRAAIDLVYRENQSQYSLIELKVGSDNPLFAAMEILMYGYPEKSL